MGWDVRNGRRYYYRPRRVGQQVVRQYIGTGPLAEREAALDVERRARRAAEGEARRAQVRLFQEAEAPALELVKVTDLIMRAALVGSGFHQHDRGAWRKRRRR